MMKFIAQISVCLLLLTQYAWATAVYEIKQADGTPSFSDQPSPGAQMIDVLPAQTSAKPPPPSQIPKNPLAVATPQAVYTSLMITTPANEATIRSNSGDVPVAVLVQPGLRADDALQILVDGKIVATQKSVTPLTLSGVTRGTHILLAQILDGSGQIIKTSPSVTFYLHSAPK